MFRRISILFTALFVCTLVFLVTGCSDPSSEDDNTTLVAVTVDSGMTNTKIGDTVVEDGKSYQVELGRHNCSWTYDGVYTTAGRDFLATTTKIHFEATGTYGKVTVE